MTGLQREDSKFEYSRWLLDLIYPGGSFRSRKCNDKKLWALMIYHVYAPLVKKKMKEMMNPLLVLALEKT